MNKNAIKKYAVWARTELIDRVRQKAFQYGITAETQGDVNAESVNNILLSKTEREQRKALIYRIMEKGFEQVMEEVAYTWFNRFSALRYMEVNNYLPTRVRVFTDENGAFKPQILAEAIHLNLDGLDMEKVYALKDAENNDDLYKYLLITQCNALSSLLPGMFQRIEDYTELLFPNNLLRRGSVIQQMIELIPEEDWKDAVQIIGWLYQYYNSEKKDDVFAALKKNVKITKENIPAATQLFTPDWIVRYMVENSLGRIFIVDSGKWLVDSISESERVAKEKETADKLGWKYYLPEAEQTPEVRQQLNTIHSSRTTDFNVKDIKIIDPCMGSGHILAYLFDTLMKIYDTYGYSTRESVQSIIKHNLYGLDIDDRAAQLAYFEVMMTAVKYDNRFLKRDEVPQPHVYAIRPSHSITADVMEYFVNGDEKLAADINTIVTEMQDADEYGSILNVTPVDFEGIYRRFKEVTEDISFYKNAVLNELLPVVRVAEILAQKYDVVVTNPPYMGGSGMNAKLSEYVKANYPDSKSDLFACFIDKGNKMTVKNGYNCMVTMQSWMFLSSFEKMRTNIISTKTIANLMHMENMVMGIAFGTTVAVFRNRYIKGFKGIYNQIKMSDIENEIPKLFPNKKNRFAQVSAENFSKIPGSPVAYWVSEKMLSTFLSQKVGDLGEANNGFTTGDNNRFLRFWSEVCYDSILLNAKDAEAAKKSEKRWFPYNKGGDYRKWYGNNEYVINWYNDGEEIREYGHLVARSKKYQFMPSISWSKISSARASFKIKEQGTMFDVAGLSLFPFERENYKYLLGLCNSCYAQKCLEFLSPTLNYETGHIAAIPVRISQKDKADIDKLVENNLSISRRDWDCFETSWDFQRHPLVKWNKDLCDVTADHIYIYIYIYGDHSKSSCPMERCFMLWQAECEERFNQLKANEEELNRIFIDIYGLQDELTPEVEDKDVTVRKADLQRDIKSLISYAVGCMFGRYSLDVEGLAFAGGEWDASKYKTIIPDADNIIPICDDEYFEDDITGLFVQFVETLYGKETLEENLKFIADALGGKGTPKEIIRNYFLNDFFGDHCKIYQKRPIYWLFDSGKKNGFKALMYMHRYQPDTIARIRTDYVHEQQERYRIAIADLENRIADSTAAERVRLNKQLSKLRDQSEEIRKYEEKIHHLADQFIAIDLDDGVKVNYAKFQDVLAKIK